VIAGKALRRLVRRDGKNRGGIHSQRESKEGVALDILRTMFVGPIMGKFLDYSLRIYRYTPSSHHEPAEEEQ
jgi:hypothetical protein